jgi:hypothetical protein
MQNTGYLFACQIINQYFAPIEQLPIYRESLHEKAQTINPECSVLT